MFLSKKNLLIAAILASTSLSAQNYNGFRTGNYSGVNGVFYNPANIADNRYKFDVNLVSIGAAVSNDQASFSLKNIKETFNADSIKNQIFGKDAGASSGLINVDIHGPSFMFSTGPKMGFAITTRSRVMGNITDLDGKLADKLVSDFFNDPELPYQITSPANMRINLHGWSELGLGVGRVLADKGKHFLKMGVTAKYLAGAGNTYINIGNFNGYLDKDLAQNDVYLRDATGRLAVGSGGINIDDFEVDQLTKMKSSGFGGDIGFVYEFRPDSEKYRVGSDKWQRDQNKYKVKVGVSLLDIGSIKYDKDPARTAAYDINVNGSEKLYMNEFDGIELDQFKQFFDARPQFFTPDASAAETSYKVSLPTTLHVDVDYHFHKGFYLNVEGILALKNSKGKVFDNYYYNSFMATPRFESKVIGVYVPVSYNELTGVNAGASFRFGPVFFGSSSVLSLLFGDSKQVDAFFGLRFGSMYKK